jgi:cysteinyl-tRNA synthetase
MALRVYSTLSRQKEPFETVKAKLVGMYLCGPTVYKPSHIGHMVGPVIFDTVKRYLSYLGYKVTFVVNITDVDDKLIVRARELGTTVKDLAERMTADYVASLRKLNVTGIDEMPKATEHIPEMIEMIAGLIGKGYAYPADGDVYFDISRDPDYGKLCNRDPEQLEAGARIEVSEKKRNPGDFALWKGAKPGEPAWESPWGPGRPGWHIECSAMSRKLLGDTLDIHGGGLDLQFPHHENELAQSESFTGKPFARYWMHNGLLKMGHVKMAGSVGNVLNVADLFQKYHPETIRFLLLQTHYRSPIDFGIRKEGDKERDPLAEARKSLEGFYRFFERYERITGRSFYDLQTPPTHRPFDTGASATELPVEVSQHRNGFLESMSDDFNTGGAVGALFDLLTTLNRFADARKLEAGAGDAAALADFERGVLVLRELSAILGLFQEPVAAAPKADDKLVGGLVSLLIDLRAEARKARNFAQADQIRKRLADLGVTLEDRPGGTGWRIEG